MKQIISFFTLMSLMNLHAQFDGNAPKTFPFLEGLKKATQEQLMELGSEMRFENIPLYDVNLSLIHI